MKVKFTAFLLLLCAVSAFSQRLITVKGNISDSLQNPIEMASVLVHEVGKNNFIGFAYTNEKGDFIISFMGKDTLKYQISMNALNYNKFTRRLDDNKMEFDFHIILEKKEIILNEVTVTAQSLPVKTSEDSTIYKSKRFLDGSERNVEDLLKKLPGMKVSDNGKIYFKGKLVDKVYLDGDDLLAGNYTLATRNIDPTKIDEVQALENFSSNSLLRGIEKSDKTVLNLRFFEDQRKVAFGNLKAAYGNQNFRELNLSLFSYLKKLKSYTTFNHNNIGIKNNPEGDEIPDIEKALENSSLTQPKPLLELENLNISQFKKERLNFNFESVASTNLIFAFTKKIKLKTNLAAYSDKNYQNQATKNDYQFNDTRFSMLENTQINKQIKVGTAKIEAEYLIRDNAKTKYVAQGQFFSNKIIQNILFSGSNISNETLQADLNNKFKFFNQNLNFTYRFPNKKAFTFDVTHQIAHLPQVYNIRTDGLRYSTFFKLPNYYQQLNQTISKPFEEINLTSKLFGIKNKSKYFFQAGVSISNQIQNTSLGILDDKSDSLLYLQGFQNNVRFRKQDFFVGSGLSQTFGKLNVSTNLSFHNLALRVEQSNTTNRHIAYYEPKLSLLYRFNLISSIRGSYSYSKDFSDINHLTENYWLQGFRTFQRGMPQIVQSNVESYNLAFNHHDTYNQFMIVSSLLYLKRKNTFGNTYALSSAFDFSTQNIIPANNILAYSVSSDKFIAPISSSIKFEANISQNRFTNQINDQGIRSNTLINGMYRFSYTSVFKTKINGTLGATYYDTQFSSELSDVHSFSKNEWNTLFLNIRYRAKQHFWSVNTERYFINKKSYYFIDMNAKYTFRNKKVNIELSAKNLSNTKVFQQVFLSDYNTAQNQYALLSRAIILGINYNF